MKKIERLQIIVSGSGVEQLLGIPKFKSVTRQAMAEAIINVIDAWSIEDHTRALSFDTTARNTGRKSGCCVLIEQFMN